MPHDSHPEVVKLRALEEPRQGRGFAPAGLLLAAIAALATASPATDFFPAP